MAGRAKPVDVELTILSARDLKNVNWRYGGLRPYAIMWVDPEHKVSTRVDPEGDTNPSWDEKLTIPVVDRPLQDAELTIEIVHEKPLELTKPLVASARIPLSQVVDEVGFNGRLERTLKLKRPSGRPQGKLDILIRLREKPWPEPQPYGTRGYPSPQYPYANPRPAGYPYPYQQPNPYAQPNPYPGSNPNSYGGSYYNEVPPVGSSQGGYYASSTAFPAAYYAQPEKPKSSKFGLGTGLAVGAVGGILGGLVLDEVIDHEEDKIEDRVAERVEDNQAFDNDDDYGVGDDYGGGDDDY